MGEHQSFKDLLVWQRASDLTVEIYSTFKDCKDFSFRDQLQRASVSMMNNIAEGHAKRSDKGFRNYLIIAKGSNAEVESMLLLATRLGYIDVARQDELVKYTTDLGKMLSGFINKLSAKDC